MMPFLFHPAELLMIPAMILAVWAQVRVKSAYQKYASIQTRSGITGAQAAYQIMREANVANVPIEMTPGEMTDHYDPVKKVLRLSGTVYQGTHRALGIAAMKWDTRFRMQPGMRQ